MKKGQALMLGHEEKKKKSAIEFQMIVTNTGFSSLSKRFQGT